MHVSVQICKKDIFISLLSKMHLNMHLIFLACYFYFNFFIFILYLNVIRYIFFLNFKYDKLLNIFIKIYILY